MQLSPPPTPPRAYQAPYRPTSHPDQCYYGAALDGSSGHDIQTSIDDTAQLALFRFTSAVRAELRLRVSAGELRMALRPDMLRALRDACDSALYDIEQIEVERDRRESFDAIQAELTEADLRGEPTGVLYAHPDVHYVAPAQVAAKARELDAAGATRYIVLPIDPIAGADDARSTRHYPSLEEGARP